MEKPTEILPTTPSSSELEQKPKLLDKVRHRVDQATNWVRERLAPRSQHEQVSEVADALTYVAEQTIDAVDSDGDERTMDEEGGVIESVAAASEYAVEGELIGQSDNPIAVLEHDGHGPDVTRAVAAIAEENPDIAGAIAAEVDRITSEAATEKEKSPVDLEISAGKILNRIIEKHRSRGEHVDEEKLTRVEQFFREGRGIKELVEMYESFSSEAGEPPLDPALIEKHLEVVLRLGFDQHIDNPEQYVSHGFDHSLNVLKSTNDIIEGVKNGEGESVVLIAVMEQYGIQDPARAKFLLLNIALLHDIGYPEITGLEKASHGVAGAELIDGPIGDPGSEVRVKDVIAELCDVPENKREALARDLGGSILLHSADKIERTYPMRVETLRGTFLLEGGSYLDVVTIVGGQENYVPPRIELHVDTQKEQSAESVIDEFIAGVTESLRGRVSESEIERIEKETRAAVVIADTDFKGRNANWGHHDHGEDSDGDHDHDGHSDEHGPEDTFAFGLEYREVTLEENPLYAIIRLADNMDATSDRFSPLQQEKAFQEFYKVIGGETGSELLEKFPELRVELDQIESSEDVLRDLYRQVELSRAAGDSTTVEELLKSCDELSQSIKAMSKRMREFNEQVMDTIISQHDDISPEVRERLLWIARESNRETMRHFGGCEAILEIQAVSDETGDRVEVTVDSDKFEKLNETEVREKKMDSNGEVTVETVPVGEYQIWRMAEAYASIGLTKPSEGEASKRLPVHVYAMIGGEKRLLKSIP